MEIRLVILLSLVVAVAGCADNSEDANVGSSSGKGLEIESLGVADKTLTPGQQTTLSLTLKNYHTQEIDIAELSVFNEGQLGVEKNGCAPSEITAAREGIAPEMECTWTITAPSEEELGAFNSKPMPVNVRIAYESSLINEEPLEVQFKPLSEIEEASPIKKSYSNGEIEVSMEIENPAPFSGRIIYISAQNSGPGSVKGGYGFSYSPDSVMNDCAEKHSEKKPVTDSKVDFSCQTSFNTDNEAVRNLFTSISYKYVKTPTVDIEVVSR